MYCIYCGKKINETVNFCPYCGRSVKSEKKTDVISNIASYQAAVDSAARSADQLHHKFARPDADYRSILEDKNSMHRFKVKAFEDDYRVTDPYTGKELCISKAEAEKIFGSDALEHLAETDHIYPLKKIWDKYGTDPWLTVEDLRKNANSNQNFEVVSHKFNNSKRDRTNEEFVSDGDYLEQTGVSLSKEGKEKAIEHSQSAQASLEKEFRKGRLHNIVQSSHEAGLEGAKYSGITALTISTITNITDLINGKKDADEALKDIAKDGLKATARGYVVSGGLATFSHSLSSSSNPILHMLSDANVTGTILTTVMSTGDTVLKYVNGEISTSECINDLGDNGTVLATSGLSMSIGQAVIPIPIVGAAVGALVGATLTSGLYQAMTQGLQQKVYEQHEREQIIKECEIIAEAERDYRKQLEEYLENYFREYRSYFNNALSQIDSAFLAGDADGVIQGANMITRKLGGTVHYETVDEFVDFLNSDQDDVL